MSTREASTSSPPIGSKADLIGWIAKGCKPKEQWRIGTEHEKILFHTDTLTPVPYESPALCVWIGSKDVSELPVLRVKGVDQTYWPHEPNRLMIVDRAFR